MIEMDWLNKQISQKSSSILELKEKTTKEIYDLESKCDDLSAENKKLKNQIDNLSKTNKEQEEQNEELNKKLQELRESFARSKELYEQESIEREKLIDHYKLEITSLTNKLEEATKMVIECQDMLVEAKNEYSNLALEKENNEVMFNGTLKEKDEFISRLDQELKNANELLSIAKRKGATVLNESDIEQLSPAAAVASRLLKSGMTLTQIYSEYVNLSEILQQEKGENERLRAYINEIMSEIEEKAPILKRQKIEFEEALQSNANLTSQLEKSMMDYEILKTKSEDSIKKYNFISSENQRLKQDVADLSRQVTTLLHEVEIHRKSKLYGTPSYQQNTSLVLNTTDDSIINDPEVSSTSEAITKHLIDFKNIEELQRQNQKLIRFAREVSEGKQSEEKAQFEAKTKEYNEKLELAFKHVEELKNQREKQEHMLEEICRQRDDYKRLVNQLQQQQQQTQAPRLLTSTPGMLRTNLNENSFNGSDSSRVDLSEKIQAQFEKYQRETQESIRMLNEEVDRSRKQISQLDTKLALSESQLESTQEKCKSLNINADKYRKDCDILKERNDKFNELIIKHEQSISHLSKELHATKEKLSEYEINLRNKSMECDWYKSNQERLAKENELLIKENSSRSMILSNLETIRTNCERQERETKIMYTDKIETLEKENKILRKQLESEQEQHSVLLKSWENQNKEITSRYNEELKSHEISKKTLGEREEQMEAFKTRLNEIEAKLHSSESLLQMTRNSKSSTTISRLTELEEENKDLQLKLTVAEKDIVNLKMQLEDTKLHSKQYSLIADNMERTIKESGEANEKTRKTLEDRVASLQAERDSLDKELRELNEKYVGLESKLNEERSQHGLKMEQIDNEMNRIKIELDQTKSNLEKAELLLNERNRDRDSYIAQLRITEEELKVERDQVNNLKHENFSLQNKLKELSSQNDDLVTSKSFGTNQSSEQLTKSNVFSSEKYAELQAKNEELSDQISKLQDELVLMGENLQILQKEKFGRTDSDEEMKDTNTDNKESLTNLIEINRFLRKQKDDIEKKFNDLKLTHEINVERLKSIESEYEYTRQKNVLYEDEIAKLKLQQKPTINIDSDEYNYVIDSNKRLTEQYEQARQELDETRQKLNVLQGEINQIKSEKSTVEFENEKLNGEKVVLESDLKRWKERVDKLLINSDLGEEWSKAQKEIEVLNDKIAYLQEESNRTVVLLTDENLTLKHEIEKYKNEADLARGQIESSKEAHQKEIDTLKNDLNIKIKKDEYSRMVINELRQLTKAVQDELEIAENLQQYPKLQHAEKLQAIKEDLIAKRVSIVNKLKQIKNELNETKAQNESNTGKLNDLEKEMANAMDKIEKQRQVTLKANEKIIKQAKAIEELKKNQQSASTSQQQLSESSEQQFELAQELESYKQKFAQAQSEINELKAKSSKSVAVAPQTTGSACKPKLSVSTSQVASQSAQPTAYIAPSRVTNAVKVNPLARRTAAVQPTPHEIAPQTTTRQVAVAPMTTTSSEPTQTWQQTIEVPATSLTQETHILHTAPSTSTGSAGVSGVSKRTREDESEENTTNQSSINKKQRQSHETVAQDSEQESNPPQVATIEPYNVTQTAEQGEILELEEEQEQITGDVVQQEEETNASDAEVGLEAAVPIYEEDRDNSNQPQNNEETEQTNDSHDSANEDLHLEIQPDDEGEDESQSQMDEPVGVASDAIESDTGHMMGEYSQDEGSNQDDKEMVQTQSDNSTPANDNNDSLAVQNAQRAPEATPSRRIPTLSQSNVPQNTSERKEPIKPIVWEENTPTQSGSQSTTHLTQTVPSSLRLRRPPQSTLTPQPRNTNPYSFIAQNLASNEQQIQVIQTQQRIIQQQQQPQQQRFLSLNRANTSWQQTGGQASAQQQAAQQRQIQTTNIRGGLQQTRGGGTSGPRGRGMGRGGF